MMCDVERDTENRMRYVPCETCNGAGEVEVRPIVGPYEDPTPHHAICADCGGYGVECVETEPVECDDEPGRTP
jgi:DnaJ-class molecular chaperone